MTRIGDATLYTGDVLAVLAGMPVESVHCVVTSPPYWGLRDYGIEPTVWDGEPGCAHEWGGGHSWKRSGGSAHSTLGEYDNGLTREAIDAKVERQTMETQTSAFCAKCGAWLGSHGLEPTPELFVQHEVLIFRAVRRVLRADGTLWLNLGDSYAGSGKGPSNSLQRPCSSLNNGQLEAGAAPTSWASVPAGLKAKDLVGIPWRVAFALQADGWYLRSACPWIKRNPMPESMTDRPATAVEYMFLLSKSGRYFYDAEAVRTRDKGTDHDRRTLRGQESLEPSGGLRNAHGGIRREQNRNGTGRNRRNSDWFMESWQGLLSDDDGDTLAFIVNPKGYKEAHFATFPRKLVQPCILAGCPEHACPKCGAPWKREVEKSERPVNGRGPKDVDGRTSRLGGGAGWRENAPIMDRVKGEHPTCECGLPPIGGTVLDPFGGSGTTAEVALEYGRRAILIELKPEYVELQKRRLAPVAGRPLLNFAEGM